MAHPDDELLSALLDGEATPGDVAHVDACGECQNRLESLRRVTALVGAPVAIPAAHVREGAFVTALLAADEPPRRLPQVLRRLDAARAARAGRPNALSAVAVLFVALAVGGLLISQLGGNSGDDARTSEATAAQDGFTADDLGAGGGAGDASLSAPAESGSSRASSRPYAGGDMGAVEDLAVVMDRADADINQPPDVVRRNSTSAASPCAYGDGEIGVWQATLTYKGERAVAHLVDGVGGRVMRILRQADCSPIVSRAFALTQSR